MLAGDIKNKIKNVLQVIEVTQLIFKKQHE